MNHRSLAAPAVAVVLAAVLVAGGVAPADAMPAPGPGAATAPTAGTSVAPAPTATAGPSATATPSAAPPAFTSPTPVATPSAAPRPSVAPGPSAPPVAPVPPAPLPSAPAPPRPTAAPRPTAPPVPPPVATALSSTRGHASSSRTVTLTGTGFGDLAGVRVAGVAVSGLQVLTPTRARFVLPPALDYQAGIAPISLTSRSTLRTAPSTLTFTYTVTNRLDRQMAYAFRNWNRYSNPRFGYLSGNDCANFASQTLLARGWQQSAQWSNAGPGRWSPAWVSSTALSTWLKRRPDLAERMRYRDRDRVVVGDVVQFRWPGHPKSYRAWDHTAIVSKVVVLPDGHHDVYYVAHTGNRRYGGGTAAIARSMKGVGIQFFHLLR